MESNTYIPFELENETVDTTLTFHRLYQLKTKHPKEYERYFELQKSGIATDLDAVEIVYIAYLCANIESMPNVMSFEEFLLKMKNGRARVWQTYQELVSDSKN